MDLALISAAVIAFAVLMYVVLDGFDLGAGILFPFAPDDKARATIINSIAPMWDGNETWLILGGGGLLVLFPTAYSIVMPAFYIPVMTLLFALIFRGVAFEFRHNAHTSRHIWDRSFFLGSIIAAFTQGILLGALVQGVTITDQRFSGGLFDWLTPFTILTGLGVLAGYALLGAGWLIMKAEGKMQAWARRAGLFAAGGVLIAMGAVSVLTPFLRPAIEHRWFSGIHSVLLAPIPLMAFVAACLVYVGLLSKTREKLAFFSTIALFVCGYAGLAVSLWPHIVPPSLSIWDAAAPRSSQTFALVGIAIVMPMILFYTGYAYSVFRGKASATGGYAHEE